MFVIITLLFLFVNHCYADECRVWADENNIIDNYCNGPKDKHGYDQQAYYKDKIHNYNIDIFTFKNDQSFLLHI